MVTTMMGMPVTMLSNVIIFQQGDPNVPSGEITFDVDLTSPLEESEEDNKSNVPNNKYNNKYPFHLPTGYFGEIPTHLKHYVRR